jgi:hypothetical protein
METPDLLRKFAQDLTRIGKACTDAVATRALESYCADLMERAAKLDRLISATGFNRRFDRNFFAAIVVVSPHMVGTCTRNNFARISGRTRTRSSRWLASSRT